MYGPVEGRRRLGVPSTNVGRQFACPFGQLLQKVGLRLGRLRLKLAGFILKSCS